MSTVTTPKRTVSFGPSDSVSPSSATTTPPSGTLKPALKPGTDRKKLPPPEQYQHPDPLLRRLRLVDPHGEPVDLKRTFRDTKVVGFYFASQWAGQPLKEYHRAISEFCIRHPHEFKVSAPHHPPNPNPIAHKRTHSDRRRKTQAIYVSVDVDEQWYKAGTKEKVSIPYLSPFFRSATSCDRDR